MKALRILATSFSLGVILIFAGCGGGGGKSETTQDKQLGLLSQTWKISTVTKDGTDVTKTTQQDWSSFQLKISGTKGATSFSYSCTGRPSLSPWPAGGGVNSLGTWAFGTDPVTQIIRDKGTADELPLTYTVTATTLQVSFSYSGNGYTRVSNVTGAWVFNFTK